MTNMFFCSVVKDDVTMLVKLMPSFEADAKGLLKLNPAFAITI